MAPPEDLITRAVMRLGARLRRVAPTSNLTSGALSLLVRLHRDGVTSAAALARAEGLEPQSLTRILARLTQDGLIARTVDADDRRRLVITINDGGRGALGRAMSERRRWLAAMIDERLDAGERDTLVAAAAIMLKLST